MPPRRLHIAWIGAMPGRGDSGGVPGVATELLHGLSALGHRIDCFFPGAKRNHKPLADVPDDSGPILAVASITLTAKPSKENPLPFRQIAIELYRPLGGGLAVGGRFAPDKMKVPPPGEDKPAK